METAERATTLAEAPIEVRSALDRKTKIVVPPAPPPKVVDFEPESAVDQDDVTPEWPNAAAEEAMRAELAGRDGSEPARKSRTQSADTLEGEPLPALDDVVAQIPDAVKKVLDELFRAQFESIRRVPAAVLKTESMD